MRDLHFKAWDIKNKCWLANGESMCLRHSGRANCFLFDNDAYDIPKEVEWIQFTGLKDKNGKEIYEGDIIKSRRNGQYEIMYVAWCDNEAEWDTYWYDYPEVIGNIYELTNQQSN